MAMKSAGLTQEDDFIAWSSRAINFDSDADCRTVWKSIHPFAPGGRAIGAGTLFKRARDHGWEPPTWERPSAGFQRQRPAPVADETGEPPIDKAAIAATMEAVGRLHSLLAQATCRQGERADHRRFAAQIG